MPIAEALSNRARVSRLNSTTWLIAMSSPFAPVRCTSPVPAAYQSLLTSGALSPMDGIPILRRGAMAVALGGDWQWQCRLSFASRNTPPITICVQTRYTATGARRKDAGACCAAKNHTRLAVLSPVANLHLQSVPTIATPGENKFAHVKHAVCDGEGIFKVQ